MQIILLDPKNHILNNSEAFKRHQLYAKKLTVLSKKNLQFVIFNANSKGKSNYFLYLLTLTRFLRNKDREIKLIICGDPWLTFWIAKLSIFLSKRKNIQLQIQIHGDFGDSNWRKQTIKNRLKYHLIYLKSRQIKSIRFVSYKQLENLKNKLPGNRPIFVAAVPLSFTRIPRHRNFSNGTKLKIVFVGRLEEERGTSALVNLYHSLLKTNLNFELNIIGNGTRGNFLKTKMNSIGQKGKVNFHGFVDTRKLVNIFASSNISLMLAPSESFGRAARESLLCSTPILAIKSAGLIQLYDEVGGNGITWLTDPKNPVLVQKEVLVATRKRVSRNTKMRLIKNSNRDLNLLLDSWISV